jgi:hypothetical protein
VSTHIGDRDLEGSVNLCNGNWDIPIRDFPTCLQSMGHRGISRWTCVTVLEVRCVGYRRLEIPTVDVADSDFPIGRSFDSGG